MRIVLDSSAAMILVLSRPGWQPVEMALRSAESILVPELYCAEVTNALWKALHFEKLEEETAREALIRCLGFPDQIHPMSELAREALEESHHLQHPAYDMFFLVLARRERASLVSFDRRLSELARRLGVATAV